MAIDPLTGLPSSNNPAPSNSTASPSGPSVISPESLATVKPITLPTQTPDLSGLTSTINSETASLLNSATQAEADYQNELNQASSLSSQISNIISSNNQAADLEQAYQQGGVNDLAAQLKKLNAQAVGLNNEAQAIPIQLQQAAQGQGVTDRGLAPIEAGKLRENALKALSLGQQAAIVQADYEAAKSKADKMVDIKYQAKEQELKVKQMQLDALKEFKLTPAQQKAKDARERAYKQEEEENTIKKEEEKSVRDMVTKASIQGAPASILSKAQELLNKGAKGTEVAMALGQWGGDYWAIEKAKADAKAAKAKAGTTTGTGVVGTYTKGQNPVVDSWVTNIQNKKATLANVPANLKNAVSQALVGGEDNLKKAQDVKTRMIDALSRLSGYSNVVIGPNAQSFPVQSQRFGDTADAIADAETLSALLTTENIQLMKGLGSMSNIEFGNIEKIGSSLIGRDKEGNAYFKGTRSNYDREIQRLLTDLGGLSVIDMSTGGTPQTQSKWQQGDTTSRQSGLSSMTEYINPEAGFGVIDFTLPATTTKLK